MKITIRLIVVYLFLIFSSSCKQEDCDRSNIIFPFRVADSVNFPFPGDDKFLMLLEDSTGKIIDTLEFIGTGKKYFHSWIEESNGSSVKCKREKYGEAFVTSYKAVNYPDTFRVAFETNEYGSLFSISFRNVFLPYHVASLDDDYYYPYLNINGHNYYKVHLNCYSNLLPCNQYYWLLNRSEGNLKIVYPDNKVFTRISH